MLAFRRALLRDVLRALRSDPDQVDEMSTEALGILEAQVTRQTLVPGYHRFWAMQQQLGLPDPFTVFPVEPALDAGIEGLRVNGFGPSTYAFEHWPIAYTESRGLNPGFDYLVPAGSPIVAAADGVIVDFRFLADPAAQSVALRPFLPGSRALSNVIVGYGHLLVDDTDAARPPDIGTQVRAGQVIGVSGYPVHTQDDGDVMIQRHNAHLHLQTHFITDGDQVFGAEMPLNPLLFFAPRWVAFQARLAQHDNHPPYPPVGQPFGKLGFFELGGFRLQPPDIVWDHQPSRGAIWPEGVYTLESMVDYAGTFESYVP